MAMRCNVLVIPGSDSRFYFSPAKAHPKPPQFATHIQVGSFRVSAAAAKTHDHCTAAPGLRTSFYEVLGIPRTGTLPEIKQAYRQLARTYHPDVSPPARIEEYTQRFLQVQEAYQTLSDPRRRAIYDRDAVKGLHKASRGKKGYQSDEGLEDRNEWKTRWQVQVSELKRRRMNRAAVENMSWAARIRRQRDES